MSITPSGITVAVAGVGAIGATVCRALIDGIEGLTLAAASDLDPERARALIDRPGFLLEFVPLGEISNHADWIVEALPAAAVPALSRQCVEAGKTLIVVSSAALLLYPKILQHAADHRGNGSRILVPAGALAGMDGINALAEKGIKSAKLVTTKPPRAFTGAPYITEQNIDLGAIDAPTTLFTGNALQAAAAFPANVNVAATLTLATRLPAENVTVEVRACPGFGANRHEVTVEGGYSTLRFTLENQPDPANPKSSTLAALSLVALLRRQAAPLWVG